MRKMASDYGQSLNQVNESNVVVIPVPLYPMDYYGNPHGLPPLYHPDHQFQYAYPFYPYYYGYPQPPAIRPMQRSPFMGDPLHPGMPFVRHDQFQQQRRCKKQKNRRPVSSVQKLNILPSEMAFPITDEVTGYTIMQANQGYNYGSGELTQGYPIQHVINCENSQPNYLHSSSGEYPQSFESQHQEINSGCNQDLVTDMSESNGNSIVYQAMTESGILNTDCIPVDILSFINSIAKSGNEFAVGLDTKRQSSEELKSIDLPTNGQVAESNSICNVNCLDETSANLPLGADIVIQVSGCNDQTAQNYDQTFVNTYLGNLDGSSDISSSFEEFSTELFDEQGKILTSGCKESQTDKQIESLKKEVLSNQQKHPSGSLVSSASSCQDKNSNKNEET